MNSKIQHSEELSLFNPIPKDSSLLSKDWIEFRPINPVTDSSLSLEFNIPPQASAYINLKECKLRVKLRLALQDGTPVSEDDTLGLINLPLHTIFRQLDIHLQQKPLPNSGTTHPYKTYIDTLLNTNQSIQEAFLTSQLFYKDYRNLDDSDPKTGSNTGLFQRYEKTKGGKIIDLEGSIPVDLFQQPKLLINGVQMGLKFWQASDAFRIITDAFTPNYKVQIVDARFKLCIQRLQNDLLLAHDKMIQDTPAMYPYFRSEIKTTSIAQGQYSFHADDIFQGRVPNKIIIGTVASVSYNGDYKTNPFNLKHYDCSYLGFFVDGQSVPSQPLQPNFEGNHFTDCYQTLTSCRNDINITYKEYKQGYCLYVLDIDPYYSFNTKRRGLCRLEIKFAKPLPESVTLLLYATFPEILTIDKARNVYIQ